LDNDEILNVRWATEDPNPVQKVLEKRRLEDMGREAIQSRMDPKIVDAMRAIRALEEGDEDGIQEDIEDEPANKRPRLTAGSESQTPSPTEAEPPKLGSILNADALEGLKYFTEIRKRNGASAPLMQKRVVPPPAIGGLALGDYGSDDEE